MRFLSGPPPVFTSLPETELATTNSEPAQNIPPDAPAVDPRPVSLTSTQSGSHTEALVPLADTGLVQRQTQVTFSTPASLPETSPVSLQVSTSPPNVAPSPVASTSQHAQSSAPVRTFSREVSTTPEPTTTRQDEFVKNTLAPSVAGIPSIANTEDMSASTPLTSSIVFAPSCIAEHTATSLIDIADEPVSQISRIFGRNYVTDALRWLQQYGLRAMAHARPPTEFFDITAFGLAEAPGILPYIDRLRINGKYFWFNYVQVWFGLTLFTVVAHPFAFIGVAVLALVYFRLFGSPDPEERLLVAGVELNDIKKVAVVLLSASLVLILATRGVTVLVAALCSTVIACVLHGTLRKRCSSFLCEV